MQVSLGACKHAPLKFTCTGVLIYPYVRGPKVTASPCTPVSSKLCPTDVQETDLESQLNFSKVSGLSCLHFSASAVKGNGEPQTA